MSIENFSAYRKRKTFIREEKEDFSVKVFLFNFESGNMSFDSCTRLASLQKTFSKSIKQQKKKKTNKTEQKTF